MTPRALIYSLLPNACKELLQRMEASPLARRLARGAFWSFGGSLISRGLGLLSAILVGRILGREEFGELGIIQNTIGLFGALAGFGMGVTANKHVAEFKHIDPERAGRILGLASATAWISSGVMAIALVLAGPWLATYTLAAPRLGGLLQIGALLLLLGGINGAQTGALSGFEAFRAVARINLFSGIATFPLMLVGAVQWGVTGVVWALVASQGLSCLLCHFAVRAEAAKFQIRYRYGDWADEWTLFWSFSLPAVLTGVLNTFVSWAAGALVVNQPSGYSEIGIYNAALRVKQLPEVFLAMLIAPMLPILSEAYGKGDRRTFQQTLLLNFLLASLITVPVSLFQVAAPAVTLLPFGHAYQGRPDIVIWIMLHALMYGLLWPMGDTLISMGRMWMSFATNVLHAVVYGVSSWFLVPRYGAVGYAASLAFAYGISNIPCVVFLYREVPDVMRQLRWGLVAGTTGFLFLVCVVVFRELPMAWGVVVGLAAALGFMGLNYGLHGSDVLRFGRESGAAGATRS